MKKTLDDRIELRINAEDKAAFIQEANSAKVPYQVLLREFVIAFINDQLRISGEKVKEIYSDN